MSVSIDELAVFNAHVHCRCRIQDIANEIVFIEVPYFQAPVGRNNNVVIWKGSHTCHKPLFLAQERPLLVVSPMEEPQVAIPQPTGNGGPNDSEARDARRGGPFLMLPRRDVPHMTSFFCNTPDLGR
jgi:hypothetical protein